MILGTVAVGRSQQAVSSITQSRLFINPSAPEGTRFVGIGDAENKNSATSSGDDSFGTQIILKNQERPPSFDIFADVSLSWTSNVDLTPDHTRGDSFLTANVGGVWRPTLIRGLATDISARLSVFRYDRANELDFERISFGAGLGWLVPHTPGIVGFGRYDFTEVLNSASRELLQDHDFTLGAQKTFVLGRSHFLSAGIIGVIGETAPASQQRDQAGVYFGYHLQITRSLDADLFYRYTGQFYGDDARTDHNQTLSLGLGYSPTRGIRLTGGVSGARNDSTKGAFGYEVINFGVGVGLAARF